MMRTSNILLIMLALGAVTLVATSCGTAVNLARINAAAYTDDLYAVHDTEALREAERKLAEQEAAERAEQEKRIAAMIAAANAEADIDDLLSDVDVVESPAGAVIATDGGNVNVYNNIYVDDYQSAYARRLQGFTSLTYRMPSSYWDYRYGDAYFLTLAYDPAFYTVMVMGDQVWVEPRYITNMFGSWNNPYYYGYRYGYNPYYYGYSYGYWDYWGWNSPYWSCDPYYHFHYHHWYNPHYGFPHYGHHDHFYPPHKPDGGGHHNKPNVTHRPSYGTSGSSMRPGGGVLSYNDRLGGGRDGSRGGTQIATGSSSTANRGSSSATSSSSARPTRGGAISDTRTPAGTTINRPTSKEELSGTLSGSTIGNISSRGVRGGGTSGVSNSSSRSSRGVAVSTGSTSQKKSSSISRSSSSRSSSSVSSGSSRSSSNRNSSSVSRSSSSRSSSSVTRSSSSRSSSSSVGSSSRSSSSVSSSSYGRSSGGGSSSRSSSRGGR